MCDIHGDSFFLVSALKYDTYGMYLEQQCDGIDGILVIRQLEILIYLNCSFDYLSALFHCFLYSMQA